MNQQKVKQLVKNGESDTLEFKTSTSALKDACQTLCGFLNCKGGIVLIGVKDDGRIVGQEITDNTRQEIARELRKLEPAAEIAVDYILFENNKFIIFLEAKPEPYKPYAYDGRPYRRIQSSTSIMPQEAYQQLLIQRKQLNHSWEKLFANEYNIDDLDEKEVRSTIIGGIKSNRIPEEASEENIPDLLSRLDLLKNNQPINAAIVLFAKNVMPSYPQLSIQMARFDGKSKSNNFIDNEQFHGNAFSILSEANNFIKRHLSVSGIYQNDSFQRIDKPTLPILALREALINSICHRNYENSSAITLAIFDDRLEIWNSGVLPKELSVEDLKKKHSSHPRNELIADTFFKRGFIEKWGTGTIKIVEGCKKHGIPEPVFEEYSSGLSITFIFEKSISRIKSPIAEIDSPPASKARQKPLSERQQEIVSIFKQSGKPELKISEISSILEKKTIKKMVAKAKKTTVHKKLSLTPPSRRTILYDLNHLKELGIVDSRGSSTAVIWFLLEKD